MIVMLKVHYLTADAVDRLRNSMDDCLQWYLSPVGSIPVLFNHDEIRSTDMQFDADGLRKILLASDTEKPCYDHVCSIAVYDRLESLTPHQASDERLWTWMSHFQYPEYVSKRWIDSISGGKERVKQKILAHFFNNDARSKMRGHGLSRLWWLGRTANIVFPENPRQFLEIVMNKRDIETQLIERPSLSMNSRVFRAIFEVMLEHWNENGANDKLFERDSFRGWLHRLIRREETLLLEAMSQDRLRSMFENERDVVLGMIG